MYKLSYTLWCNTFTCAALVFWWTPISSPVHIRSKHTHSKKQWKYLDNKEIFWKIFACKLFFMLGLFLFKFFEISSIDRLCPKFSNFKQCAYWLISLFQANILQKVDLISSCFLCFLLQMGMVLRLNCGYDYSLSSHAYPNGRPNMKCFSEWRILVYWSYLYWSGILYSREMFTQKC